jgi:hypothetical protein
VTPALLKEFGAQLGDWRWRLSNLYWITNEQGEKVLFKPKPEQLDLLDNMSDWNIVLKARQLGFTTLIDIFALDQAFFVPDYQAAIIAHERDALEEIFRHKVKTPWENMPESLRAWNPASTDKAQQLVFQKGGSIRVALSVRSGTTQLLHVSEMGKIARRYPERAREVRTGSFPTVHEGGLVFIESTAEGTGGDFYELVKEAQRLEAELVTAPRKLKRLEFKLHFYPWWKERKYRIDPDGVTINAEMARYFSELENDYGIKLDAAQAAWYVLMKRSQKDDMKREYPSTIDEAFEGANEERYFAQQLLAARREGRVKAIPFPPGRGVNLFLDIGRDMIAVWAHQYVNGEHRFVDYYEVSGKTLDAVALEAQRRSWLVKQIYLPHDGTRKSVVTTVTPEKLMTQLFPGVKVRIVARPLDKLSSINQARAMLWESYFHEINCSVGLDHLDNYRKEWNERLGNWGDEPRHDIHSHGADAYQTFALGWEPGHEQAITPANYPGLTVRSYT